jgi:hypothetical protein
MGLGGIFRGLLLLRGRRIPAAHATVARLLPRAPAACQPSTEPASLLSEFPGPVRRAAVDRDSYWRWRRRCRVCLRASRRKPPEFHRHGQVCACTRRPWIYPRTAAWAGSCYSAGSSACATSPLSLAASPGHHPQWGHRPLSWPRSPESPAAFPQARASIARACPPAA